MQLETFAVEAEVEAAHWWFVGRRRLFARELARAGLNSKSRVLDVGTGTGANLRLLRELRVEDIVGLESNDAAIQYCVSKGLGPVQQGDICMMPFADGSFDFVLATDVIEHVDRDNVALAQVLRVLKRGGRALIAVPAFPSLWGLQDVVAHHKRRYVMRELRTKMQAAGFTLQRCYYFNYLLFLPIWVARRMIGLLGLKRDSEAEFNSPFLNRLLLLVFAVDVSTAPLLHVPFGVSILAVGQKR
jgi:SAM-dependent methyltransferase